MTSSVTPGDRERQAFLARHLCTLDALLHHRQRQGRPLDTIALYLFDLLDPVGYALGHGLRARLGGPDPDRVIRAALGVTPPRRPVAVGMMAPTILGELAVRLVPDSAPIAAQLQGPPLPLCVRVVIAAGAGADLVPLPLVPGGAAGEA